MNGPLCTDADAWHAASGIRGATGSEQRYRHITDALAAAGVPLGAYDLKIARWLAMWEPETVAAVLSWACRAHAAGRAVPRPRRPATPPKEPAP